MEERKDPDVLGLRGDEIETERQNFEKAHVLFQKLYRAVGIAGPDNTIVVDTPHQGQNVRYFLTTPKEQREHHKRRVDLARLVDSSGVGDPGGSISHRIARNLQRRRFIHEMLADIQAIFPGKGSMIARPTCYGQFEVWTEAGRETEVGKLCMELAELVGFWWAYESVVVICRKPSIIQVNEAGRLHCEDGPAIVWESTFDGNQEAYFLHGRKTTREICRGSVLKEYVPSQLYWRSYGFTAHNRLCGATGARVDSALSDKATCNYQEFRHVSGTPVPDKSCTCGYYAMSTLEQLRESFGDTPVALVEVIGKGIIHTGGVRAEQVRIIGLAPGSELPEVVQEIGRELGVMVYSTPEELDTIGRAEWEATQRIGEAQ